MNANNLLDQLRNVVGNDHLLTDDQTVSSLLNDWRGRYHGQARCVVRPADTAAVAAVVKICAAHHAPVVPQGGNTSLCGAATPSETGDS
ncbi:MAG TPA: FAD-binding protein, partial [Accumulibacter sp.]|nr:FAD-binding protein [Accumulibacter sp.]